MMFSYRSGSRYICGTVLYHTALRQYQIFATCFGQNGDVFKIEMTPQDPGGANPETLAYDEQTVTYDQAALTGASFVNFSFATLDTDKHGLKLDVLLNAAAWHSFDDTVIKSTEGALWTINTFTRVIEMTDLLQVTSSNHVGPENYYLYFGAGLLQDAAANGLVILGESKHRSYSEAHAAPSHKLSGLVDSDLPWIKFTPYVPSSANTCYWWMIIGPAATDLTVRYTGPTELLPAGTDRTYVLNAATFDPLFLEPDWPVII